MQIVSGEGLDESVAIITGGGAVGNGIGNGRAAALLLADGGARVLVVDKELSFAQKTVEMISNNGNYFDVEIPLFSLDSPYESKRIH